MTPTKLHRELKKIGMSQYRLAEKTGLNRATISRYISGKQVLKPENMEVVENVIRPLIEEFNAKKS